MRVMGYLNPFVLMRGAAKAKLILSKPMLLNVSTDILGDVLSARRCCCLALRRDVLRLCLVASLLISLSSYQDQSDADGYQPGGDNN